MQKTKVFNKIVIQLLELGIVAGRLLAAEAAVKEPAAAAESAGAETALRAL